MVVCLSPTRIGGFRLGLPRFFVSSRHRATLFAMTKTHKLVPDRQRDRHLQWACELTGLPTGAGREHRVVKWVRDWVSRRPSIRMKRDRFGNLLLSMPGRSRGRGRPLIFTAHLDHPAFVVRRIVDDKTVHLEFRGGVHESYFDNGRIVIHAGDGTQRRARIVSHEKGKVFREAMAVVAGPGRRRVDGIEVSDLATWDLKPSRVTARGMMHSPACDDLAGAAAALSALDVLSKKRGWDGDVRVLLTRAEEVGFVGAIQACQSGIIPKNAQLIALETSRTFSDSPIGNGPIVRVGDRISVFHHGLTFLACQVAEKLVSDSDGRFTWQRKLMPGGACEATAFQAFGYEATSMCLALGNYHNQGKIDDLQAGTLKGRPRIAQEFVSVEDYHGLVLLLVASGWGLTGRNPRGKGKVMPTSDGAAQIRDRMHNLISERGFVLEEPEAKIT